MSNLFLLFWKSVNKSVKKSLKSLSKKSIKKSFKKICHKIFQKIYQKIHQKTCPKICPKNLSKIFPKKSFKNVSNSTKLEYFKADPVFTMTMFNTMYLLFKCNFFFQLSPLAEHCVMGSFRYISLPIGVLWHLFFWKTILKLDLRLVLLLDYQL